MEIMVEVLTILAIATKEAKRRRLSESMSHGFTYLTHASFRKVLEVVDGKHRRRG